METITKKQFIEDFKTSKGIYFISSDFTHNNILLLPEFERLVKAQKIDKEDLRHYKSHTQTRIYFEKSYLDLAQIGVSRKYVKFDNYYIYQLYCNEKFFVTEDNPSGDAFTTIIYKVNQ